MTGGVRDLPAVHAVVDRAEARASVDRWGRDAVVDSVVAVLDRLRERILSGEKVDGRCLEPAAVARHAVGRLEHLARRRQVPVVNATGVIIHTNLGRSVLSLRAGEAVAEAARSYTNLEMDLETGERGSRQALVEDLVCHLTGADAALVVNNNAAAVLLALRVLAAGRQVVISRGQLVEIGGSFRIPDVMAESGALLVEVGTTNRTHIADYERVLGPETALLLSVHPSNYEVVGFTAEVEGERLVELGRSRGIPVMLDLGSGAMISPGAAGEPLVRDAISTGYDVVTFSGDKMLGGPQAGIMAGSAQTIERCRNHPLLRAVRPDKLQMAALEATLGHYLSPGEAESQVPTVAMMSLDPGGLRERAEGLAAGVREVVPASWKVDVEPTTSRVGGGALPGRGLDGFAVFVDPGGGETEVAAGLRGSRPPVVARVRAGGLVLDPRTLLEGQESLVVRAFRDLTSG